MTTAYHGPTSKSVSHDVNADIGRDNLLLDLSTFRLDKVMSLDISKNWIFCLEDLCRIWLPALQQLKISDSTRVFVFSIIVISSKN